MPTTKRKKKIEVEDYSLDNTSLVWFLFGYNLTIVMVFMGMYYMTKSLWTLPLLLFLAYPENEYYIDGVKQ